MNALKQNASLAKQLHDHVLEAVDHGLLPRPCSRNAMLTCTLSPTARSAMAFCVVCTSSPAPLGAVLTVTMASPADRQQAVMYMMACTTWPCQSDLGLLAIDNGSYMLGLRGSMQTCRRCAFLCDTALLLSR